MSKAQQPQHQEEQGDINQSTTGPPEWHQEHRIGRGEDKPRLSIRLDGEQQHSHDDFKDDHQPNPELEQGQNPSRPHRPVEAKEREVCKSLIELGYGQEQVGVDPCPNPT